MANQLCSNCGGVHPPGACPVVEVAGPDTGQTTQGRITKDGKCGSCGTKLPGIVVEAVQDRNEPYNCPVCQLPL